MSNDHYIPRMLTKPWETPQRQLRYFDFGTETFSERSSKNLFARRELNSPELEAWLNATIEDPAAKHIEQIRKHEGTVPSDWRTQKALALLVYLNSQRIQEATVGRDGPFSLEDLAREGDSLSDHIADHFYKTFRFLGVPSGPEFPLFFPEVGFFPYPMPETPVMAMPVDPTFAFIIYDGLMTREQLLESISRKHLSVLSLGVGSTVRRVILPPALHVASVQDETTVREVIVALRRDARKLFNLVGEMSVKGGLRGWVAT